MMDQQQTPESAHHTAMIIWAALIAGVIFVAAVLWFVSREMDPPPVNPTLEHLLLAVASGVTIAACVVGVFLRRLFLSRRDVNGRLSPQRYLMAHLVPTGIVEGAVITSLVFTLVAGALFPLVIPGLIAFAAMVLMKPNKSLMIKGSDAAVD